MFGTTEEVFFNYFDFEVLTGKRIMLHKKAYNQFNPINYVDKWNTPILIIKAEKTSVYQSDRAGSLPGCSNSWDKSRFLYLQKKITGF
jgi:hypothetical protein